MNILEDIIIQYTYPRLDAEVSKHRNHLLKAPFCVHPKTGRVCVPLDLESIDKFDPESVPTLGQLLRELDTIGMTMDKEQTRDAHSGASNTLAAFELNALLIMPSNKDWENTSLKPYIDIMEKHSITIMDEVRREKRKTGSFHRLSKRVKMALMVFR